MDRRAAQTGRLSRGDLAAHADSAAVAGVVGGHARTAIACRTLAVLQAGILRAAAGHAGAAACVARALLGRRYMRERPRRRIKGDTCRAGFRS
jgi:hypothetical protein